MICDIFSSNTLIFAKKSIFIVINEYEWTRRDFQYLTFTDEIIRTRSLRCARAALYQIELRAHEYKSANEMKKKEVIQPQVPLRLPCDDLTRLTEHRFNLTNKLSFTYTLLGWFDGRCVQGAGTYSPDDDDV